MGASTSRIEEDKALQICSERKKFVKQALNGRCSLAASHVNYIQSLGKVGTALRRFVEPEAPIESSLCTSTSATPEPFVFNDKSPSRFSFSSPTLSQHVDATEPFSPSPPYSCRFQVNHMRFEGAESKKEEKNPLLPVTGIVMPSNIPHNTTPRSLKLPEVSPFEVDRLSSVNWPWDYFNLVGASDNENMNQPLENADNLRRLREADRISEFEDGEDTNIYVSREESEESEDEFDEPPADTLVRSFENLNRVSDHAETSVLLPMPDVKTTTLETKRSNLKKNKSSDWSPLEGTSPLATSLTKTNTTPVKKDVAETKVAHEDIFTSMKYIEELFLKASESGKEVPRMLEANKLHFRPIATRKEGGLATSTIFKACFSCGDNLSSVPEEHPQASMKYLTWHRTESSRSSSARILLSSISKDDTEDVNSGLFENFCMNSGSHVSTLDRLYAWERKLYDDVKASKMVRRKYDVKCKILRQLESTGSSSYRIDKTRAVVKDLHSRILVAIHRIHHISTMIEELRDKELLPQLEELIKGLNHMWNEMTKYHKLQHNAISIIQGNSGIRISLQSEYHRHITVHLANELGSLTSSFTKWMSAQKSYLQAINGWLEKCVLLPPQRKKKNSFTPTTSWTIFGPPIYRVCEVWLEKFMILPTKDVVGSIKGLSAETSHFLPHPEKKGVKNSESNDILSDEASEFEPLRFDRFRSSLVGFLGQLTNFSESSKRMYEDLDMEIDRAKLSYEQWKVFVTEQS